jgi:O-antigen/teichoic acid export membrane protein
MTKHRVSSAILWIAAQTVFRQIISFCLFVMLGRLLDPVDFGIVSLSASIVFIMQTFSAFGIVQAVVQKPNLTDEDANTAFTFNLIASWCLFAAVVLGTLLFAYLYLGHPNLTCWILIILALSLPVSSLYEVHQARLIREFQFNIIAKKTIAGIFFSGVIAVCCALLGAGVWSLVVQQFVTLLIELLIVRKASHWKPAFRFDRDLISHLFRFSAYLFGSRFLGVADVRSPDLFIGAFAGPLFIGYFRIARSMFDTAFSFFSAPIGGIALPLFSSKQTQPSDVRRLYLKMCEAMCWVLFPPFFTLVLWAPVIVETVFGEKWRTSGWVLQLLAVQILVYATVYLSEPLLIGLGRTRDVLIIRSWQTGINISLLIATSPFGFFAMIVAQVVGPFLAAPIMFSYASRAIDLDVRTFVLSIWKPVVLATVFAGMTAILQIMESYQFGLAGLFVNLTICYICYCVSFYFFATPDLRQEVLDNIHRLFPSGTN